MRLRFGHFAGLEGVAHHQFTAFAVPVSLINTQVTVIYSNREKLKLRGVVVVSRALHKNYKRYEYKNYEASR